MQNETPLNSLQIRQALKATLLYRIIVVIIALITLPNRENLPTLMADWYGVIAFPLVCWNLILLIFMKSVIRFLKQHPQWLIVDLYLLVKEEIRILSGMTGFQWYLEKSENDFFIPESMQPALCSFISEAMTNAWKHSKTNEGWIKLKRINIKIQIDIIDRGNGFILANIKKYKTSGITSLFRRAEEIQGSLNIETAPGKGCHCRLIFPTDS